MNSYYEALRRMKVVLGQDEDINTVTKGNIQDVDLERKNIYGLGHIMINGARFPSSALVVFEVSVFALDIRNASVKDSVSRSDKFIGDDNEDDNLNSMLLVLHKFYERIKMFGDDFCVVDAPQLEPFTESQMNLLDGWMMRFELELPISGLERIDIGKCE